LNKVRKLAEELLTKYPTLFSSNFEANKKALEKVAIIRNHALRNQIAGAISSMVSEQAPSPKEETATELQDLISQEEPATEQTSVPTEVSQQAQ
jgi:small subunit ribosomal protein S17e